MKYYEIPNTNNVIGFNDDDTAGINEAIADGWIDVTNEYPQPVPPLPLTAEENKQIAVSLLQATDWAAIADVGNSQISNPYLANQAEFVAYRNLVRQYAVYPVKGNIDWPEIPSEKWIKV